MGAKQLVRVCLCSCVLCTTAFSNPLDNDETSEKVAVAMEWAKKAYYPRVPRDTTAYIDPHSGFKSLIKVLPGSPETIVISFRGTASTGGVLSNLSLNYPQFRTPEFLHTLRKVRKLIKQKTPTPQIIVTGHSSGGGLAEALSYELVSRSTPEERKNLKVDLITWNGIGAKDWYEHTHKNFTLDPEVISHINGLHFRADKDVVSRLGEHMLGDTWSWDASSQEALVAHKIPLDLHELKQKKLTQHTPKELLGKLTGPPFSRHFFVSTSYLAIQTKRACAIALRIRIKKTK